MKHYIIAVLLFAAGLLSFANAQSPHVRVLILPHPSTVSAIGYQGPIDAAGVTAKFAGGLRCLSSTYCGGNLANVCTTIATVDTCLDFSSDATTGNILLVTIGGLTCGGAVICNVKTLYGQSASNSCTTECNATNATVATRPVLTVNCIGSLPCMTCNGAASLTTGTLGATLTQANWISYVANRTVASAAGVIGDSGSGESHGFSSSANTLLMFAGSSLSKGSITDGSTHAVQSVANGASSQIYADGSSTTGAGGAGNLSGTIKLCVDGFGNGLNGKLFEALIFNSAPDATKNSNVNANQHSYWGF